jgi:hypothetical protein
MSNIKPKPNYVEYITSRSVLRNIAARTDIDIEDPKMEEFSEEVVVFLAELLAEGRWLRDLLNKKEEK